MYLYLLLFAGIALCYAGFLYFKKDLRYSTWVRYLLFSLRFLLVFGILYLFLSPNVRTMQKKIEKPLCVVGVDMSASMRGVWKDSLQRSACLKNISASISRASSLSKTETQWNTIGFGSHCRDLEQRDGGGLLGPDLDFLDQYTDFSDFFSFIQNGFENRSGAVVLFSDGHYNKGLDPLYDYKKIGFPLYTVYVGDTTVYPDWYIENYEHNKYAYKGSEFPVRVSLGAASVGADNKSATWLDVIHKGKSILKTKVDSYNSQSFVDIYLPATETGLESYQLVLKSGIKERNLKNNSRLFYIDVLESKSKVLILSSYSHPDIGALRKALERNERYEVVVKVGKIGNGSGKNIAEEIEKSESVILYGLPSVGSEMESVMPALRQKSLFFILTPTTSSALYNSFKTGLEMPSRPIFEEAIGAYNSEFGYFSVDGGKKVEDMPPCNAVLGMEARDGAVLLYQKIGRVGTKYPLWWFNKQAGKSYGVLSGEGLWKWRMWDYVNNGNTDVIDGFISQSAMLLSVKSEDNLLQVNASKVYESIVPVKMSALLYDKTGTKITDADISMDIIDSAGKVYSYMFEPGMDVYSLSVGVLGSGEYRYKAQAAVGKDIYNETGLFRVENIDLEQVDLPVAREDMDALALRYGGRSFGWDGHSVAGLDSIYAEIVKDLSKRSDFKPRLVYQEREHSLANEFWVLCVLIAIACSEYGIRRYFF